MANFNKLVVMFFAVIVLVFAGFGLAESTSTVADSKASGPSTLSTAFVQAAHYTTSTTSFHSQYTESPSLEKVTVSARDQDLSTITCLTDKAITLPRLAVMEAFVEPFCQYSDGTQLRGSRLQSGPGAYVWADPIKHGFRVGTKIWVQPENWIYVVEEALCTQIFQLIADKCAEEFVFKGGLWYTNHVIYEFRLLEV